MSTSTARTAVLLLTEVRAKIEKSFTDVPHTPLYICTEIRNAADRLGTPESAKVSGLLIDKINTQLEGTTFLSWLLKHSSTVRAEIELLSSHEFKLKLSKHKYDWVSLLIMDEQFCLMEHE